MATQAFDAWFKAELKRRLWNQSRFSRESGVAKSTVSAWWRGARRPDPESVEVIAKTFGIRASYVMSILEHLPEDERDPHADKSDELAAMLDQFVMTEERYLILLRNIEVFIEEDRRVARSVLSEVPVWADSHSR